MVIATLLRSAWVWLLPVAGPVLAKLLPHLPALAKVGRWVRVGTYAAVLIAGAWGGAELLKWWRADYLSPEAAVAQCERQRAAEGHAAAVARSMLERSIVSAVDREREQSNVMIDDLLEKAESLERRLAATAADDPLCIPADLAKELNR